MSLSMGSKSPWDFHHHLGCNICWLTFPFASKSRKYKITLVFQNPPVIPSEEVSKEPLKACKKEGLKIPPQKAPGRLGFWEFFIGDKRLQKTAYRASGVFHMIFVWNWLPDGRGEPGWGLGLMVETSHPQNRIIGGKAGKPFLRTYLGP